MLLQKLTKSYSSSLPTYSPIPSSPPPPAHHATGGFSCTYSPQHSVGVARVTVQSAEILPRPRRWNRWFERAPSAWVRVKVLGRTMGGVEKGKGGRMGGKGIKTWREDRVVGETGVRQKTYTPNFEFKSYYALIGPYEKQLELEVRSKRRRNWLWPFGGSTREGEVVGSTTFVLPGHGHHTAPHTNSPPPLHPGGESAGAGSGYTYPTAHPGVATVSGSAGVGSGAASMGVAYSDLDEVHTPAPRTHVDSRRLSRRSFESVSSTSSRTAAAHGAEAEQPEAQNEWAVQAPLFKKGKSRIEGYLLYNVFWYPALPVEFQRPVFKRHGRQEREDQSASEGDDDNGGGGGPAPTPGIVTFTLHAVDDLSTPEDREVRATVSLGWRLSPLHTARGTKVVCSVPPPPPRPVPSVAIQPPEGTYVYSQATGMTDRPRFQHRPYSHTRSVDEDFGEEVGIGGHGEGEGGQGKTTQTTMFDSTFEFMCVDPSSTNVVLKIHETYTGRMGGEKRELVGHTSVPLRDLIQSHLAGDHDPSYSSQGEKGLVGRGRGEGGRDRVLALLEHPTAKARVCVEWRALEIPTSVQHHHRHRNTHAALTKER